MLLAQPRAALWLTADGELHAQGVRTAGRGFLEALENWWRAESRPATQLPAALPFSGGWALFLSYELAQEIEPHLKLPRTPLPWQAFALRTPLRAGARARKRPRARRGRGGRRGRARGASWRTRARPQPRPRRPTRSELVGVSEEEAGAYLARVARAKEYVRAGDIYQANLSRPWDVRIRAGGGLPRGRGRSTGGCAPPIPHPSPHSRSGRGSAS